MPGRKPKAEPEVEAGWRLTWGNRTWTEDDLTTGDILDLALLVGNDWRQMIPSLGPLQRAMFLVVLEARATGDSFEVVRERVRAAPAVEFLGALTIDE